MPEMQAFPKPETDSRFRDFAAGNLRELNRRKLAGLMLLLMLAWSIFPGNALAFLRATPKGALATPSGPQKGERAADEHQARRAVDASSFYDPASPGIERLQRIEEATKGLPHDAQGFPDWMRALREGLIEPRSDLTGKGGMEVLDLDIIMKNTREMPHVRFPHRSHTLWLACANCHPEPFKPIAGSTAIRMADIFRGQYCGMCHDRVAFITFFSCNRCHSGNLPDSGR